MIQDPQLETNQANQEKQTKIIASLFRPKFGVSDAYREETTEEEIIEVDTKKENNKKNKFIRGGVSEADYSGLKIFAIIADISILAFLFVYSLTVGLPLFVIITALVFLASSITLLPLLIKSVILHAFVAIIVSVTLAFTLFWFGNIAIIYAGVFAFFSALMLFVGIVRAKQEIDNSLRISFIKFTGMILPKAFVVISMAVALVYGLSFKAEYLFSDRLISGVINLSSPIVGYYIPAFTPETQFRDLFTEIAERTIVTQNIANFDNMPEASRAELISQAVEVSYKNFEASFGVDINLNESFAENIRIILTTRVADIVKAIPENSFAVAIIIIIFIAVRGTLWLFGWFVLGVAFFVYQLLLAIKFAEVYLEARRKEVLLVK